MIHRRDVTRAIGLGVGAAALAATALPAAAEAATAAPFAGTNTDAATLPGTRGGASAAAPAAPPTVPALTPGTHTSLPAPKQVRAGVLDIGYAELGPADGPVAILLHGWPYDIHSYVDVAPLLAAEGYRVLVPYLRGYGTTTFLSRTTPRNGQQSALAADLVAFMDALRIRAAVLGGFDWGARTADIVAALWPERVKALVSVGGYLVVDREAQLAPAAPAVEHTWWYEFYFATPRGAKALADPVHRVELARYVWGLVSPTWRFDEATFRRTAAAFANRDHAAVVLHNYRWRLGLARGQRRYERFERTLAGAPAVTVPTITLDPLLDPFTAPGDGASYRARFTGAYEHRTLPAIGHNLPQEAPTAFAQAVVDVDRF